MRRLRARLPTPNSLVAFEAAGRLCSFTLAAGELSVTQAAVGRQIRALEDRLGILLFDRSHRMLRLTVQGQRYHEIVSASLERIAEATAEIAARSDTQPLTVSSWPAIAIFWLIPRLGRFRERVPGIDLRVVTFDGNPDLVGEGVDLAILYGDGGWPGVEAELIFGEEVFPVCSPGYLARRSNGRPLQVAADLAGETLLYFNNERVNWLDWPQWLAAAGVDTRNLAPDVRFNSYANAIQAALNGQGIALAWRHLHDELLEDGSLVRPIAASQRTSAGYFIASPADRPKSDVARLFQAWLKEEAASAKPLPAPRQAVRSVSPTARLGRPVRRQRTSARQPVL